MPNKELYFEDFHVGQRFDSVGSYKVTATEIKEFGEKYDPQPFHLDEAAGEGSFFHGLAASGWLTAAIVMRLRVLSITRSRWHDRRRRRGDALDRSGPARRLHPHRDRGRRRPLLQASARNTASSPPPPSPTTSATRSSCAPPSTSSLRDDTSNRKAPLRLARLFRISLAASLTVSALHILPFQLALATRW